MVGTQKQEKKITSTECIFTKLKPSTSYEIVMRVLTQTGFSETTCISVTTSTTGMFIYVIVVGLL